MGRNFSLVGLFVMTLLADCAHGGAITVSVDLTISPTVNLSDVYLVEGYTPTLGFANTPTAYSLGHLSANTTANFSNVPDTLFSGTSIFGGPTLNYFTIIGLYDVPNGLVTIGFRDSIASFFVGEAFGVAVPGGLSNGFSGTEATLATALKSNDTATIGSVLTTLIDISYPPLGTAAAPIANLTNTLTLDNFSTAALGGTASLSIVTVTTPEPATALTVLAFLAGLSAVPFLAFIKRTRARGSPRIEHPRLVV